MVLTSPWLLPPLSKLYQIQNVIQTNSHQLCKGRGGGGQYHIALIICVTPSLLNGRNIFFLSVLTFLQLLV